MIKVLHIIQGYGGGVSSLVRNLIVASDKACIRQDVMSFIYENGEEFIEVLRQNGSETFLMPRPRKSGYKSFKNYVLKVMKDGGYDVVHCHSDGWRAVIFKKLSKKAGIKLFCIHAHRTSNNPGFIQNNSAYFKFNRFLSRKNADIKFTCGTEAARFIYGDCDDYVTIPNGIDLNKCNNVLSLNRVELRKNLGIDENEIMIFHAGRFVVQKNHGFIIDIADKLRAKDVKFKFFLAGSGDLEPQVKALIQEKGLEANVKLLGRRNDIYELMYASDCVILPSTSEGLPTVAMEAQVMGIPCFASDNVTAECDMMLGLVDFLSINTVDPWVESIINLKNVSTPSREVIEDAFNKSAYTSIGSFKRYLSTLQLKLSKL